MKHLSASERVTSVGLWGCSTGAAATLFMLCRGSGGSGGGGGSGNRHDVSVEEEEATRLALRRVRFAVLDSVYSSFKASIAKAVQDASAAGIGVPALVLSAGVSVLHRKVQDRLGRRFALDELSPLSQAQHASDVPVFIAVPRER